jgi:hypothetical protein
VTFAWVLIGAVGYYMEKAKSVNILLNVLELVRYAEHRECTVQGIRPTYLVAPLLITEPFAFFWSDEWTSCRLQASETGSQ